MQLSDIGVLTSLPPNACSIAAFAADIVSCTCFFRCMHSVDIAAAASRSSMRGSRCARYRSVSCSLTNATTWRAISVGYAYRRTTSEMRVPRTLGSVAV